MTFAILVALGATLAATTTAQDCDYAEQSNCIKAEASTSVALPFPTLFSTPPTFVFAIDNLTNQDIQAMENANEGVHVPAGPVQAVSWWLEYDNATVNFDDAQEREYTAWALESNSNNSIGGSDGGCGDLLGATCVSDLKNLFTDKHTIFSGGVKPVGDSLYDFFRTPPERVNCPTVFWGGGPNESRSVFEGTSDSLPLTLDSLKFARMTDVYLYTTDPLPSGNASLTHGTSRMRFRSHEEQKALAIIGFTLGWPASGDWARDNVTIEMACLRVGEAPEGNGSPSRAGLGATVTTSTVILSVIAAMSTFLIIQPY